jgi:hypothetical protein
LVSNRLSPLQSRKRGETGGGVAQGAGGAERGWFVGEAEAGAFGQAVGGGCDSLLDRLAEMAGEDEEFLDTVALQLAHEPEEEGSFAHFQHRLGDFLGNRPQPRRQPSGQDRTLRHCSVTHA